MSGSTVAGGAATVSGGAATVAGGAATVAGGAASLVGAGAGALAGTTKPPHPMAVLRMLKGAGRRFKAGSGGTVTTPASAPLKASVTTVGPATVLDLRFNTPSYVGDKPASFTATLDPGISSAPESDPLIVMDDARTPFDPVPAKLLLSSAGNRQATVGDARGWVPGTSYTLTPSGSDFVTNAPAKP